MCLVARALCDGLWYVEHGELAVWNTLLLDSLACAQRSFSKVVTG